jgi:ubiquinone/menaquinone biosynthesis C-methylase UbiE
MQTPTIWRAAAREFFNERAEAISATVNTATLCYVSGREQRLWTDPVLYQDLMASIQNQLELTKEHSLLEVGCAAGFLAPGLANMVGKYVGLDVATKAVEVARSLGISNGEFRVGDGNHLPWPDESFDRVICYDVFTNFPSFEPVSKIIREMVRVCRRGGKVMAGSVPDDDVKEAFQEKVQKVVKDLDEKHGPVNNVTETPSFGRRLHRWLKHKVLRAKPDVVCYYFRRGDFIDQAKDLGVAWEMNDIHALNPYRGYRFNVVYSKPRQA